MLIKCLYLLKLNRQLSNIHDMKITLLTSISLFTLNSAICQQITTLDTQPFAVQSSADAKVMFFDLGNTVPNVSGANVFVGYRAGQSNVSGYNNTFVGTSAGASNTGNGNTFLGYRAGLGNQSGSANVFIGQVAGASNTTGLGNLFLGQQAGFNNTTGNYNLFMGNSSGNNTTTGIGNTAIGDGSALNNTTGQRNTAIGQYAGLNNQSGTDNVFIGFGAKAGNANPTNVFNAAAIGANAIVSRSNSIVLGNNVNVGIGTSTPLNKLELVSENTNASGLRLTNLKSSSPATVLNTNKFLTVDANGDVIMGSTNSSARVAADAGWEADGENLKNTNSGGVVVGEVSSTPAGYKLYVAGGVLTEKVKVAVKSTADWSDRVFDPSYRLRSLSEVSRFIDKNKHLPGVASAEEVVQEGVDVGQMQAKLLEKVEELTLYMIKLERTIELQRREIRLLKAAHAQKKRIDTATKHP